MATSIPSPFCRVQFKDEDEEFRAALLSAPNKDWIQHLMSMAAQRRLNLEYDPANPLLFMQAEASLKGEIQTYQYLLEASNAAVEYLQSLQTPQ
jgi:hypothetical protein